MFLYETHCLSASHKGNPYNEFKREYTIKLMHTHIHVYSEPMRVLRSIKYKPVCVCKYVNALLCLSVFLHEIDHIF